MVRFHFPYLSNALGIHNVIIWQSAFRQYVCMGSDVIGFIKQMHCSLIIKIKLSMVLNILFDYGTIDFT